MPSADLVLYFGLRAALAYGARFRELRAMFAKAHIVGCSTGGQIRNDDVDDEIAAVALRFEQTRLKLACEAAPGARAFAKLRRGDRRASSRPTISPAFSFCPTG